jgi:hypothetical protein
MIKKYSVIFVASLACLFVVPAEARLMVKVSPEDLAEAGNQRPPEGGKVNLPDADRRGLAPLSGEREGSPEARAWMGIDSKNGTPEADSFDDVILYVAGFGTVEALDKGGFRRYSDIDPLLQAKPALMRELASRDVKEFKGCKIPALNLSAGQRILLNEIKTALAKGAAKPGEDGMQFGDLSSSEGDLIALSYLGLAKEALEKYKDGQATAMINSKLKQNGCKTFEEKAAEEEKGPAVDHESKK